MMRNVLSSVVLASLVGCATTTGSPCGAGAHRAIQELLYFGAETPLGYVTPDNSAQFLNETVTPRFPEGAFGVAGVRPMAFGFRESDS
ncbi:MAG: DUF3574 domain-containing protein [Nitrospirota bacterium]